MQKVDMSTLIDMIDVHAANNPDKPAVISRDQVLTYGELDSKIRAVSAFLSDNGVKKGDRVAVSCEDAVLHMIGLYGAMRLGAIAVALPENATLATYIMDDSTPSALLTSKTAKLPAFSDGAALVGNLTEICAVAGQVLPFSGPEINAEDIAMIYYTSGTSSGVKKGVMQSHRQLQATAAYINKVMQVDDSIREYIGSPVDNAFWFGRVRCLLTVGGTIITTSGPINPFGIISDLLKHEGNSLSGDTPLFMLMLGQLSRHFGRVAETLRWVKVASAPMPLAQKEQILTTIPNARIIMNYGLTEAMRSCLLSLRDHPDVMASAGRASPGLSVRIVDMQGQPVGPQTRGEIEVRGANIASGYWGKNNLWQKKQHDGWFKTGDFGSMDKDGFVYVGGRLDEAINSGGKTIALDEVYEQILPFFNHTKFAVCGMDDPKGIQGEVIALCIEGEWREDQSWKDMRVKLFETIDAKHVPTTGYSLPELPRTDNGKVRRNRIRALIDSNKASIL